MEKPVSWEPAVLVMLATAGWGSYCSWAPGLQVAAISITHLAQPLPAQMPPVSTLELLGFTLLDSSRQKPGSLVFVLEALDIK